MRCQDFFKDRFGWLLEVLCLTMILGGGLVLAACVRSFFLRTQAVSANPEIISTVEDLSIKAWNRYNRYSFLCSLGLLALDVIRFSAGMVLSFWHLATILVLVLAFMRKFSIDHQLSKRLRDEAAGAVGSKEQNAGHREVEMITKLILILAFVTLLLMNLP